MEDNNILQIKDQEDFECCEGMFGENITKIIFENNNIDVFDGICLPDSIKEFIYINNNTSRIKNLKEGMIKIVINDTEITKLKLPSSVIKANINSNFELTKLTCGNNLQELDMTMTGLDDIDNLPDTIEILKCNSCTIPIINKLPKNLKIFHARNTEIEEINCIFPDSLIDLDLIENNDLTVCPPINESIIRLVMPVRKKSIMKDIIMRNIVRNSDNETRKKNNLIRIMNSDKTYNL